MSREYVHIYNHWPVSLYEAPVFAFTLGPTLDPRPLQSVDETRPRSVIVPCDLPAGLQGGEPQLQNIALQTSLLGHGLLRDDAQLGDGDIPTSFKVPRPSQSRSVGTLLARTLRQGT